MMLPPKKENTMKHRDAAARQYASLQKNILLQSKRSMLGQDPISTYPFITSNNFSLDLFLDIPSDHISQANETIRSTSRGFISNLDIDEINKKMTTMGKLVLLIKFESTKRNQFKES